MFNSVNPVLLCLSKAPKGLIKSTWAIVRQRKDRQVWQAVRINRRYLRSRRKEQNRTKGKENIRGQTPRHPDRQTDRQPQSKS